MTDKMFDFEGRAVTIADPDEIEFANGYLEAAYRFFFGNLNEGQYSPQFDMDQVHAGNPVFDFRGLAAAEGVAIGQPSAKAPNPDRSLTQLHLRYFLEAYPEFAGFFRNTVSSANIAIKNAEFLHDAVCNGDNFIRLKEIIDTINSSAWSRDKDRSESQSGVSVLGGISETLLSKIFSGMLDESNFFKIGSSEVQSYGDFVVSCLPNNLWISVKSNFARERLLASGYSNDIVGAGFFEDPVEFTNAVRIRNFQRAGFLAMYCPDVSVTPQQRGDGTSTYHLIETFHETEGTDMPLNINGRPFIRKLSELSQDIRLLLNVADIRRRFIVRF